MLIILSGSISGVNHSANQNRPITMLLCILHKYKSSLYLILERYFRIRGIMQCKHVENV